MSAEVADTLRRAKAVLIERGWIRHKRFDEKTGACCAAGAIIIATENAHGPRYMQMVRAFERAANPSGATFIGDFNDAQSSVEPVLAAFDRAIAAAEAES